MDWSSSATCLDVIESILFFSDCRNYRMLAEGYSILFDEFFCTFEKFCHITSTRFHVSLIKLRLAANLPLLISPMK